MRRRHIRRSLMHLFPLIRRKNLTQVQRQAGFHLFYGRARIGNLVDLRGCLLLLYRRVIHHGAEDNFVLLQRRLQTDYGDMAIQRERIQLLDLIWRQTEMRCDLGILPPLAVVSAKAITEVFMALTSVSMRSRTTGARHVVVHSRRIRRRIALRSSLLRISGYTQRCGGQRRNGNDQIWLHDSLSSGKELIFLPCSFRRVYSPFVYFNSVAVADFAGFVCGCVISRDVL